MKLSKTLLKAPSRLALYSELKMVFNKHNGIEQGGELFGPDTF